MLCVNALMGFFYFSTHTDNPTEETIPNVDLYQCPNGLFLFFYGQKSNVGELHVN